MERLTLAKVCDLASGQDIREVKVVNASRKDIKHVDDIRYSMSRDHTYQLSALCMQNAHNTLFTQYLDSPTIMLYCLCSV